MSLSVSEEVESGLISNCWFRTVIPLSLEGEGVSGTANLVNNFSMAWTVDDWSFVTRLVRVERLLGRLSKVHLKVV